MKKAADINLISPGRRISHAFAKAAHECMERYQKPSPSSRRIFLYRRISFGPGAIEGPGIFLVFDLASTLPRLHWGTSVGCDCRRFGGGYGSWRSRTASGRRYARVQALSFVLIPFGQVIITLAAQRNIVTATRTLHAAGIGRHCLWIVDELKFPLGCSYAATRSST